ncbi:MAG: DUF4011 domain-containing protein, partial [Methylococcales bacterium]|nr:DUF4011 domain-containing protein [Methylococcales bacterium]
MTDNTSAEFSLDSLADLRKRLLDLSGRNRLLNYPSHQGSSLSIIDELPDPMVTQLLNDVEMRFYSVAEPTRQQLIEHQYLEV